MKITRYVVVVAIIGLLRAAPARADPISINFDNLADGDLVTTQYLGITFTNATVLTAGISLNEFEFPPHSDFNVVFDDGGPISLLFGTPVGSFSVYFTFAVPLTLYAYDAADILVGSVAAAFLSNLTLSGDPGSTPNELLQIAWAQGITRIVIEGDSLGGSFTMDDITATSVPEPATLFLLTLGGAGLALRRRTGR